MKSETQALHLARMMQRHIQNPSYEVTLPLVMVPKKKLKKLQVDDVLLTGLDRLELILINGDRICANIQLEKMKNGYKSEVIHLNKNPIKQSDSKKYDILKLSYGEVQTKVLEVGQDIDITHIDLVSVKLVLEDKIIAEGSLVMVDEEIAVQVKRVN